MTRGELILTMVGNELMKDIWHSSMTGLDERKINYDICCVVSKVKTIISNMEKCELLKDIMSSERMM